MSVDARVSSAAERKRRDAAEWVLMVVLGAINLALVVTLAVYTYLRGQTLLFWLGFLLPVLVSRSSFPNQHPARQPGRAPRRSKSIDGWKAWLTANNALVMAILLLVLGVKFFGQGLGGLID
jgi:hypothetical protein